MPARRIALLVETSYASGRETLRGIAAFVREHGVVWEIDHESRRLEKGPPEWFRGWKGHGVIARLHSQRTVDAIRKLCIPAVDTYGLVRGLGIPLVFTDDSAVGRLAAQHLLERRFTSFAFVGVKHARHSNDRRDAFVEAVRAAGYDCAVFEFAQHVRYITPPMEHADKLAAWLGKQRRPLGIMANSDRYAGITAAACRAAGLAVPDDAAIIGVDNDETLCDLATPSITSIDPNAFARGYEAAALLHAILEGRYGPRAPWRGLPDRVSVPPIGITVRKSTDCLAIDDPDVAAALRLIRSHATERLAIADIADRLGLSRSTLVRRFREHVGHGVHDEIMRVRVGEAQRLLAESDLSLLAIARRCGFEYQEHLGRVFRRRLGTSPAAYRKHVRRKTSTGPKPHE